MAQLHIYRDAERIGTVELIGHDLRIGRARENDVVLEDDGQAVSRFHAEIREIEGHVHLVNLSQPFGLIVNGRRVERAVLAPAAAVYLGPYRLELAPTESSRAAAAPLGAAVTPVAEAPAGQAQIKPIVPAPQGGGAPARPGRVQPAARRAGGRSTAVAASLTAILAVAVGIGAMVLVAQLMAPSRVRPAEVVAASPQEAEPTAPVVTTLTNAETDAPPSAAYQQAPAPPAVPEPEAAPVAPQAKASAQPPKAGRTGAPKKAEDPFAGRDRDAVRRFLVAQAAADSGKYRLAVSNLQSVLRTDPTFPKAEALLESVKARVRTAAEQAFAEGERFEQSGDYGQALKAYTQSRDLAADMFGEMRGADEAINRVKASATQAGQDAFKRARQYDALGRTGDAVTMYQRALQYLPEDDPNRQVAKDRLSALKPGH